MSTSKQITTAQLNVARSMIQSLAKHQLDSDNLERQLKSLNKNEGIVLVASLGHILKVRNTLNSKTSMSIIGPVLKGAGIDVNVSAVSHDCFL
ncbi:MAG: hypothetical protein WCG31_11850 [Deltaproteobacteria bacterium]